PRVQLPLDRHLLAVLDLDDFLRRHERLTDRPLLGRAGVELDLPLNQGAHLVLVAGRRLNGVPAVFHGRRGHRAKSDGTSRTSTPLNTQSRTVMRSASRSTKMMIAIVADWTCGRSG